jgi:hypothetical protein
MLLLAAACATPPEPSRPTGPPATPPVEGKTPVGAKIEAFGAT